MTLPDEIIETFKNFKTFTSKDVYTALIAEHKGLSKETLQVTISRMLRKRQLYKVVKGVFSLQMHDELSGFAFSPFYYGGLAALMIRDLIDNQVRMEIMTTKTVKNSKVKIYNKTFVTLHHLPRKYYFGFEEISYAGLKVPVSTPEKTLIDLFYYNETLSLNDYAELLKVINTKKLAKCLKVYSKTMKTRVTKFVKENKPLALGGKLENKY